MSIDSIIKDKFMVMSLAEKAEFIKSLSKSELKYFQNHPELLLADYQMIPDGDWRYYWLRGARSIGKTYSSMAWLATKALNGAQEVAIVGPNHIVLKKEIVPTFIKHLPPNSIQSMDQTAGLIILKNGCTVKLYSSEYEIRGCNAEYAVAEEIAKWCQQIPEKIQECWDIFNAGVRSTRIANPQILIASTPKPFPFFIEFEKKALSGNPRYGMKVVTIDQAEHIPVSQRQALIEDLNEYDRRQELYAELITAIPGALWDYDLIQKAHENASLPPLETRYRVIIAIDVAVSSGKNSDETGIIVGCLAPGLQDANGMPTSKIYILEDASGKYTPDAWADKVNQLFNTYQADLIVAEKNNGGEMIAHTLHTANNALPVKLVHASRGKIPHAEPVAALYGRGLVKHCGKFPLLEQQMTSYTAISSKSPDRMDALVWLVHELGILPQPNRRNLYNLPKFG